MTDYDYLVRLRFTLRKKVLNDNDSVNKVHTFEQKSVRKPLNESKQRSNLLFTNKLKQSTFASKTFSGFGLKVLNFGF